MRSATWCRSPLLQWPQGASFLAEEGPGPPLQPLLRTPPRFRLLRGRTASVARRWQFQWRRHQSCSPPLSGTVAAESREGAMSPFLPQGGIDYSARALTEVVKDFSLVDAFRALHPSDAGFTWHNSRGAASPYIFMGGGISGMSCVLLPSWASDHDMLSLPMDRPKWGPGFWRLNTSLLGSDAFVKAFTGAAQGTFQALLCELEEGERPTAYFFKASRARRGASAIAGFRRVDDTLAEGPAMLAVAESYYAKLFSRRACDPAAEAYLLDCISVSSVQSLGRIRVWTNLFRAGTGSKVNMAKSSVLFCGRWTEDIGDSGGFAVCGGGLNILGIRFWARGSVAQNWEARLALVRVRETGADVHSGGGGGGVPTVPLKLDVLYASFASRVFLERAPHKCFFLARYYLVGFFMHLVALKHVVAQADVRSLAYETVARFFRQCPPSVLRAEALDHRALYARLACRQVVSPSGVPVRVRWGRVSGGGAPAAVRDLHW
ncbi:hypothetical protein AAFF_G00382890 [Aldrovandia affinis]|uniref:Uncharacterized protein n=1 Tax=Aldrovandia affinis TaxID=143900 RepID=A0AAD7T8J6_9TELE|nr:hypothetical protein AAFF_G00382890 [Aldrovandia affinis]